MPTIGELTGFDGKRLEEKEIRRELNNHVCPKCVVEKRLKKDRSANFALLSDLQRSLYRETSRLPHRCNNDQGRMFKYEKCTCTHAGEVHCEEGLNRYGKCNMKDCLCTRYVCANV